jgi:hypothetical protein
MKGKKPQTAEALAAEVERLRGELAERDRGAVRLIAENIQLRQALRQAKEAHRIAELESQLAVRMPDTGSAERIRELEEQVAHLPPTERRRIQGLLKLRSVTAVSTCGNS